jgi:hypothetical protein
MSFKCERLFHHQVRNINWSVVWATDTVRDGVRTLTSFQEV